MLVAGDWVSLQLDKEFTRMRSRLTFFYGGTYHLTREETRPDLERVTVSFRRLR